ncbi:MAG: hypothetical protein ACR2MN_07175 [Acidimicrobiales bacterium]
MTEPMIVLNIAGHLITAGITRHEDLESAGAGQRLRRQQARFTTHNESSETAILAAIADRTIIRRPTNNTSYRGVNYTRCFTETSSKTHFWLDLQEIHEPLVEDGVAGLVDHR